MLNRLAAVLVVLSVAGCRTVEPPPPPDAPRVTSFTASKARIAAGESVTLSFTTSGATKVDVTDDAGRDVVLAGTAESGTATVAPTRSSFYVLRATGVGGRDTAFVQIAVNEPLKDLFLIAVPATINSGDEAQLLWGAPGASSVTLKTGAAGMAMPLTGTTGTVRVSPTVSEQYTLTAQGAPGTPPLTALTRIAVRPVLSDATFSSPDGVVAGASLRFTWKTAGAQRVAVTERTFGPLTSTTDPAAVAQGSYDWTLPDKLPTGIDVADGLPLDFTVTAFAGEDAITRTFRAVVGDLPVVQQVTAPEFATAGGTITIAWRTLNATQVSLLANGLPIFTTLPGSQTRVDSGSLTLPSPSAATEYTVVASTARGATARKGFNVRPVAPPSLASYTLTPSINAFGDSATARWTTMNASRIVVRIANGPTLGVVETPSQVASGSLSFTPATDTDVTVEAYNAAGDRAEQTRTVRFATPVASISPAPVLRGTQVTLSWTLSPSVQEVVGLPTPAPAAVSASPNFVDLSTTTTATELPIFDPASGIEKLQLPPGFRFQMLGIMRPELYVSVDGFITFAPPPSALISNADFTASGNTSPSMIAPFWDDLTMAPTSKILYSVLTATSGERYLVVQWNKLQIAGDGNSELTFEAHLYETGQVAFVYKTTTGTLNSATIGINDTGFPASQQFSFNSTTQQAVPDLELNFFTGGPADGTLQFIAGGTRRVNFFGRTATGLVPVSAALRSFGAGDLAISEVMVNPEATATSGQWVEVRNTADASINLQGLSVRSTGSAAVDGGYVIGDAPVGPYGYYVLGQSTDTSLNGGAVVNEAYTDVPLANADTLRVTLQGADIAAFTWADAGLPVGTSLQVRDGVLLAGGSSPFCTRTRTVTFGTAGAFGSPGAANESCGGYAMASIPGNFIATPANATIITTSSADESYANGVPLSPTFTFYGTSYASFALSTNGFMSFDTLSSSSSFNATAPSSAAPNNVIAPFWDDLVREGNNATWRATDRTIITWERARIFSSTSATNTQINFQVHLLDNGVIELHYGDIATTVTTQSTIDRVFGNSATIWLEAPGGTEAVAWRVNQNNAVAPNMGIRFTPFP
jgi:hypothetical protein